MEPAVVTCIFENVVWGDSTHYTCHMSSYYRVNKLNPRIKKLQGVHMAGRSNDDVTAVSMKITLAKLIPRGLNVFFKNLEILELSKNGLASHKTV
jgi:hypothetical protein